MSIEDVLALLNEDRPAGWLQYLDGSWAPVCQDGWVGPPITADVLGHADPSMTQRRYTARGRVHPVAADALHRAVSLDRNSGP